VAEARLERDITVSSSATRLATVAESIAAVFKVACSPGTLQLALAASAEAEPIKALWLIAQSLEIVASATAAALSVERLTADLASAALYTTILRYPTPARLTIREVVFYTIVAQRRCRPVGRAISPLIQCL
jgi:hypothetical protein